MFARQGDGGIGVFLRHRPLPSQLMKNRREQQRMRQSVRFGQIMGERHRLPHEGQRPIGLADKPQRPRGEATQRYSRVQRVEKRVVAMLVRFVERDGLVEVLDSQGKLPLVGERDLHRPVASQGNAGVRKALGEPQELGGDLEGRRQFRLQGMKDPESPEHLRDLRRVTQPLAERSGFQVRLADVRRGVPFARNQRYAQRDVQRELLPGALGACPAVWRAIPARGARARRPPGRRTGAWRCRLPAGDSVPPAGNSRHARSASPAPRQCRWCSRDTRSLPALRIAGGAGLRLDAESRSYNTFRYTACTKPKRPTTSPFGRT